MAHPDILFWVLPFMILVLIVGTVTQKEIGILAAEQRYFSSYFYVLGFIPLPGGLTLITILFFNLLAKFLFRSEWSWAKSGTILAHFGVLVLILGGGITYATSHEGYVMVGEGKATDTIEDYHQRVFVVKEGDKIIYEAPFKTLKEGQVITPINTPLSITLAEVCYNCGISRRPESEQEGWTSPGQFMKLSDKDNDPTDEKNMAGVEFHVTGTGDGDGKYLTFDKFPKPPQIDVKGVTYTMAVERAKRHLPFTLLLEEFKQGFHPGTDMARSYQSKLIVKDGEISWPVLIEMNEPFRYRGYTFYQSSFDISGKTPYTILTAVENKGRIFPYISTIIIALGLILHISLRIAGRRKQHV